jgi:hypothetical protein
MRAMGGEAQGNLLAEPGAAAGDKDALSFEEVSVEHGKGQSRYSNRRIVA